MKKSFLVAIIGFSLFFSGCNGQELKTVYDAQKKNEQTAKVDNNQKEIGSIIGEVAVYEFEEAVAKADLIAKIEILDIFKEIDQPSPKTIFKSNLIETIKGTSEEKEIFIIQQGNSELIFNGTPLFKKGENYLLFLMETNNFDIENSYWILGEETGMYKIIDESIAVKMALRDEDLAGLEISDRDIISLVEENTGLHTKERGMQILNQDGLMDRIKEVSEDME